MSEPRWPVRPGRVRTGRGDEIRLVDPTGCPGCGQFRFGQRGRQPCVTHGGHPTWTCACGQILYGHDGAFVDQLPCC